MRSLEKNQPIIDPHGKKIISGYNADSDGSVMLPAIENQLQMIDTWILEEAIIMHIQFHPSEHYKGDRILFVQKKLERGRTKHRQNLFKK